MPTTTDFLVPSEKLHWLLQTRPVRYSSSLPAPSPAYPWQGPRYPHDSEAEAEPGKLFAATPAASAPATDFRSESRHRCADTALNPGKSSEWHSIAPAMRWLHKEIGLRQFGALPIHCCSLLLHDLEEDRDCHDSILMAARHEARFVGNARRASLGRKRGPLL